MVWHCIDEIFDLIAVVRHEFLAITITEVEMTRGDDIIAIFYDIIQFGISHAWIISSYIITGINSPVYIEFGKESLSHPFGWLAISGSINIFF